MTDLAKLRAVIEEEDGYIHEVDLANDHGVPRWSSREGRQIRRLGPDDDIPAPPTCVFCNAPWSPEMIELIEMSGYCSSCSDSERVIDVFCATCTRLVYRKEVR